MKPQSKGFATGQLLDRLALFPATARYWVGFSGGIDSTALLVALHEQAAGLAAEIRAVHFNHGLHTESDHWQAHCQSFCDQRGVQLHVQRLELNMSKGQSPEQPARKLRYASVEKLLDDDEIFLTAHHADDNAETLFLNLMRGSGMEGLAGIPPLRKIGKGWVARPLLEVRHHDLENFLRDRDIPWLDDPSNLDLAFDRNYIRNHLFPDLEQRWPGVVQRLNRTANHARDFSAVLAKMLTTHHGGLLADPQILELESLLTLEPDLQAILLRQWLREREIILPPKQGLGEFLAQLNTSEKADRQPELRWSDQLIKKHGSMLWSHQSDWPDLCPSLRWNSGMTVDLGIDFGQIQLVGISSLNTATWEIGPRRKGDQMRLHRGGPRRKLKDLMRECGLPPWLRNAIPVLYRQGEVAAVGDWLLSFEFQNYLSDNESTYSWQPTHPLLCKLQSVSVQHLGVQHLGVQHLRVQHLGVHHLGEEKFSDEK